MAAVAGTNVSWATYRPSIDVDVVGRHTATDDLRAARAPCGNTVPDDVDAKGAVVIPIEP